MNKISTIKQVRAVLEKDPRINLHRYPIAIAAQDGDLILAGEVKSIAAKKLALLAASKTHGVGRIVDRLKITPTEQMGDAEIRDYVCKILFQEPALENCTIEGFVGNHVATEKAAGEPEGSILVAVSDGTVILNGEVPSLTHKRLAGVLAWWVTGTRDVVNGLEEVPAQEDNDDEVTGAVRLALERDPFVDATKIRVTTKEWVVTMDGLVPNEAMKQMAELDAWYVLGVSEVINRIQAER